MGIIRAPCCDKQNVKKGIWSAEEDTKLLAYVSTHGTGNWTNVPKKAGLKRCGKSCRLRWTNYLRPNLKHEGFTPQEEELIVALHANIGSRWSIIANQLPGRTDNDVKNYWNTKLSKKLALSGIDPVTHHPISEVKQSVTTLDITVPTTATASIDHRDSRLISLDRDLKKFLLSPPILLPFSSSTSPPPPLEHDLEWVHFLAEDAFSCLNEQQDAYRGPSFVSIDDGLDRLEEARDGSSSFIDEILNQDQEIMSELSGLVGGHYAL